MTFERFLNVINSMSINPYVSIISRDRREEWIYLLIFIRNFVYCVFKMALKFMIAIVMFDWFLLENIAIWRKSFSSIFFCFLIFSGCFDNCIVIDHKYIHFDAILISQHIFATQWIVNCIICLLESIWWLKI